MPSDAAIPSNNVVRAEFDLYVANTAATKSGTKAITTVTHQIPPATIRVEPSSAPVGSSIDVFGQGFRPFTAVNTLKVGGIDVTPSPKPATNDQGRLLFTFIIPSADIGIQTVELDVGGFCCK
ncbi:MAG: hypothetical protein O2909_12795 [Chloroflexi bacterium]|nr:hypothetical protein [Chloroflexota bacterium]MDA1220287.1 hypothetical protein [Chloroflexota bacterium]